jgi:primosomal protein N' (replication factor Y)
MKETFVNIAIPSTVRKLFTYILPSDMADNIHPGQRLLVPFGQRNVIGYYIESAKNKPNVKIRKVSEVIDPQPLFSGELFQFLQWMAEYYYTNIADVLNAALPPTLRKLKKRPVITGKAVKRDIPDGILLGYKLSESYQDELITDLKNIFVNSVLLSKQELLSSGLTAYRIKKLINENTLQPVCGLPDIFGYFQPRDKVETIEPNLEQKEAINEVTNNLNKFAPYLLYGITGSGKTLVYCHIAGKVLDINKTVLVLVPEIALAGTLLSYFKSFFGDKVALIHSGLKPKERQLIWMNIKNGKYKIVVGARSAIFAPLQNLGLIIVDEEHDESFKQDDPAPRFQARDAAVMRAKMAKIPIVLGSATPSIESFFNAESGRYKLLKLTRRPEDAEIPIVRVVDLKKEHTSTEEGLFFTKTIVSKIKQSIKKNNQTILYLNRRGFSPKIKCADCGHTPDCPHCNIAMTFHKKGHKLMCHFCGFTDTNYHSCAECNGDKFIYIGVGTQKIEDILEELIENARTVRLDSDIITARNQAHHILSDFAARKYNILLGTQMVAKGIDFPDVSLVGVMMADIGLDMPDFRASEKLFAKLIQVAGRSGRGIIPGEVVIQTFRPKLDLIDDAARQDYDTYYQREILSRQQLKYPPYSRLVNFKFSGKTENTVIKSSHDFRKNIENKLKNSGIKIIILGPAPCPLYRLRGRYRRHLIIKTGQITKFVKFLNDWENEQPGFGLPSSIRFTIDIDPYDMM